MKKLMLVFAALLLVSVTGFSQAGPEAAPFLVTCDVAANGIAIDAAQLDVTGMSPGMTIELVPAGDGTFIDAGGNAAETNVIGGSVPAIITITVDPNVNIAVSFAMPSVLYADGLAGSVTVRYSGTSGDWTDGGAANFRYFNPTSGFTALVDEGGVIVAEVGGIFTVTPGSAQGMYQGNAVVTVAYVTSM
jgi:hypothetical protein